MCAAAPRARLAPCPAAHHLPPDQPFAPLLYGGALGARLGPPDDHLIIEARALWSDDLADPIATLGIAWIGGS